MTYTRTLAILALIAFAGTMRLLPHAPNMTPLTAVALVGGLYLGRSWAVVLPVASLLLSDLVIGGYDLRIMLSVYGSFALIGCIGALSGMRRSVFVTATAIIGSSLLFFVITNGVVWAYSPWYEKSLNGLLYCYELGLPFLRNMLSGDIIYTFSLIAVFELVRYVRFDIYVYSYYKDTRHNNRRITDDTIALDSP